MGKLSTYKVELKNMRESSCQYEYALDNQFFEDIEAPEVQKGTLSVLLNVKKGLGVYILDFHIEGKVTVPCDRCLDDMGILVDTDNTLKVKLGLEFSDGDDFVIIPEEEGYINVAWFIYEFIALSLPMKHVHALGQCNEDMIGTLSQHLAISLTEDDNTEEDDLTEESGESDDENRVIDSRWNELKKILDNN